MKTLSMRAMLRVALAGVTAAALASGIAVGAAVEQPPNHANRLEATFEETRLAVTDRADLEIRQVITFGTGTLAGFGAATEIAAVSQDRTVSPCGPGSDTSPVMRRIVVPEGTLILKTLAHRCPTPSGLIALGEYEVDGAASTGVFANAWGQGSDTVEIEPPPSGAIIATISGKLHLVQ
jgi:hypothetical protein